VQEKGVQSVLEERKENRTAGSLSPERENNGTGVGVNITCSFNKFRIMADTDAVKLGHSEAV
jgi:hypothetical protein